MYRLYKRFPDDLVPIAEMVRALLAHFTDSFRCFLTCLTWLR
jgi:hypothetical protein